MRKIFQRGKSISSKTSTTFIKSLMRDKNRDTPNTITMKDFSNMIHLERILCSSIGMRNTFPNTFHIAFEYRWETLYTSFPKGYSQQGIFFNFNITQRNTMFAKFSPSLLIILTNCIFPMPLM